MERDAIVDRVRVRVRDGAVVHEGRAGAVISTGPMWVDGMVGVRLDATDKRREAHAWIHHRDLEPEVRDGA